MSKKRALILLLPIILKCKINKLDNCSICLNKTINPIIFKCTHHYCIECIK